MNAIPKEFNPTIVAPNFLIRRGLLRAVKKYAPALSGKMMDFGCGAKPYRSLFSVSEYIGVDYDGEGHSHHNENIDVFYDGRTIPFAQDTFDAIFSTEVFEHIFNIDDILKELHRVLKPGGKMLITCPFVICEHEVPNDSARYTSFGLKYLLQQNGFKIIAFEKIGNAVLATNQLWITYIHQHVLSKVKNIPILRSILRMTVYPMMNLNAFFQNAIFPKRKDLYLNNVVLAEKV